MTSSCAGCINHSFWKESTHEVVVTYTYKCTSTHAQTWSFLSWNISICSTSVVCSPPSPPFSRINDSLCAFRITDRALSGPRTANGGLHAGVSGAVTGGITCVRRCSGTRVCMHVSEYILQEKSQFTDFASCDQVDTRRVSKTSSHACSRLTLVHMQRKIFTHGCFTASTDCAAVIAITIHTVSFPRTFRRIRISQALPMCPHVNDPRKCDDIIQ